MRWLPLVTVVALGEIFLAKPCSAQFYGGYAPQQSVNQYTGFGGAPNYGGAPAQYYAPPQNVNPYPQNYSGAPAQNYAPQQYPQNYGRAPGQNYAPPQNVNRYTGFGGTPVPSYSPPAQYYNAQPTPVQATSQRMPAQYQQQPSTMQNLERALNQVDTNNAWARTAAVTAQPARTAYATPQAGYYAAQQPGYASAQQQQVGMMPRVTRRDIARVFMQGGSLWGGGGGGGFGAAAPSAGSAQATSTTYSYYQKAENMAIRARNAANRTLSGDKWSKGSYADEAYYDANDSESAANSAYDAAQSGDSQARNYAGMARDASDRARADANRARYNADTAR